MGHRTNKGKSRPQAEVMKELEQKVVQAAPKLQEQLANNPGVFATVVPSSAAQPGTSSVASAEQPAISSSEQPSRKPKRAHAKASNSAVKPAS